MQINTKQLLGLSLLILPSLGEAHPLIGESIGFLGGLIHQLTSAEHVIVMTAVGLWLAQLNPKTHLLMPFGFTTLMFIGGAMTLSSFSSIYIENTRLLPILLLGLTLLSTIKISSLIAAIVISSFGLFYGYTHAETMLLDVNAPHYSAGFALATILLNFIGIYLSKAARHIPYHNLTRILYSLAISIGTWLIAAP